MGKTRIGIKWLRQILGMDCPDRPSARELREVATRLSQERAWGEPTTSRPARFTVSAAGGGFYLVAIPREWIDDGRTVTIVGRQN